MQQPITGKWGTKEYVCLFTDNTGAELRAVIPAKSLKEALGVAETIPNLKEIHGLFSPQAQKVLPPERPTNAVNSETKG